MTTTTTPATAPRPTRSRRRTPTTPASRRRSRPLRSRSRRRRPARPASRPSSPRARSRTRPRGPARPAPPRRAERRRRDGAGSAESAPGLRSRARPARIGAVPRELKVGDTFAGHRIDALAGRGGMGVVYRATDLALDRQVALKLIAPAAALDPVFRARFEHECRAAAAIDHPHAVEVFHAGEEDGVLYVTMRYVEGTDLGALLADEQSLDPARAVGLIAQVAGALDEAHRHGLVHRDVKPTNVLIARRGGAEHAFLTDFGLTKRPEDDLGLTKPGFAMGTADYMSPEQARGGDVDARA